MSIAIGQSEDRTPGKHTLLDKLLGREAGVCVSQRFLRRSGRFLIDLCAGDGVPTDASGTSSPAIFAKHARWQREQGHRINLVLVERQPNHYDRLVRNVEPHDDTYVILADAREADAIPAHLIIGRSSGFVHNDPNKITDFALSDELVRRLPEYTTTLSTLGCNVGGLKRLSSGERLGWYAHVDRIRGLMDDHHDALLVALNGDDSQWAYILTGPAKWCPKYEANVRAAFCTWPRGVSMAWARGQSEDFKRLCDQLFMTRGERGGQ